MDPTQLETLFDQLFGWMNRESVGMTFLAAAVLMAIIGLFMLTVQPRHIGGMLVAVAGLGTVLQTFIWYFLPDMNHGHNWVLAWLIFYGSFSATALAVASRKPSAKLYGQSVPLALMAAGFTCYLLDFILETAVFNLYDNPARTTGWYAYVFGIATSRVLGTALISVGVAASLIMRVRAHEKLNKPVNEPAELAEEPTS